MMDNILTEIDKAYQKGISDPRFQPAIKDLEEKIAEVEIAKSKAQEKEKDDKQKSKEDEENVLE